MPRLLCALALAGLCAGKFTVAVTGTHGKTTTTSLIGMILKEAGRDPSVVVGGLVEAYSEVARLLGIMQENEKPHSGGPKLVQ